MKKKEMIMKIIKYTIAVLFSLATMIICTVDTDYAPISHIITLVSVWMLLGLVVSIINWKN
jgi:uncharacterized membrane protein YcaP (DUF421 family)